MCVCTARSVGNRPQPHRERADAFGGELVAASGERPKSLTSAMDNRGHQLRCDG